MYSILAIDRAILILRDISTVQQYLLALNYM